MVFYKTSTFRGLALLIVLLVALALACGGSDEPELVATAPSETEQQDDAPEEDAESVTSEEIVETDAEDAPEPEVQEPEDAEEQPAVPDAYVVGDVVSIGDSVIVVLGWEVVPGDDFFQPDEGNMFVAVEMMVVNQSSSSMSLSTLIQMSLKDESSQTYDVDLFAATATDTGSVDGELAPGEAVRGKVGFQVPEDVQNLEFVFDESFFGTGKVFVDLGSEPISVEPPAEIAGQVEQEIFNVGEVITIGDSVLVVLGWEEVLGDDFSQPEEGNRFIAVELLLVNRSDSDASISTLLQMSLKDDESLVYDVDLGAEMANDSGSIDGRLVPGERVRGKVGFQVPVEATGLMFVFDADVFGTGKVNIGLGDEPVTMEPPAEVVGESRLTLFNMGESVQTGPFLITVNETLSPPGDDFFGPDEGNKFLVVDLTIENTTGEAEIFSSLLQMGLKDETGQVYDVDIFAPTESMPDGEISAGETVRGQIGFQVPEDATGLIFVLDADILGEGKLFVALP